MRSHDAAQRRAVVGQGTNKIKPNNNSQVPGDVAHSDIADISQTPIQIAQEIHENNTRMLTCHEQNHEYDEPPPSTLVQDHLGYAPPRRATCLLKIKTT